MSIRYPISKKEKKKLGELLEIYVGINASDLKKMLVVKEKKNGYDLYYIDSTPVLVVTENGETFPHLQYFINRSVLNTKMPKIWIDSGAVVPVGKGADLMAPGITKIDGEFEKGTLALVVAPNGTPVAVVKTMYSSNELRGLKRGKVAKNLHHIGDKYWSK